MMSEGGKFFARPKVRFSQIDAAALTTKGLKNFSDQKDVKRSVKPSITSIIKLNKPIRLVRLNKIDCENKDSKISNDFRESDPSASSLNEKCTKTENRAPLNSANNIQNIKANCKEIESPGASTKSLIDNETVPTDSAAKHSKNVDQTVKTNVAKSKQEKENKAANKVAKKDAAKTADLEILKHKARLSLAATKKSNISNKTQASVASKKKLSSKATVVNVMPCYKHKKVLSKSKSPPVKKTLIRDGISTETSKPCIGPGMPRKRLDNLEFTEPNEDTHLKSSVSGEKLARPEYNSIMCTIHKLNEMKKQKIVTDMEHLPAEYKSLINDKVSAALDFPLDEAIYKNLVDLNIDENQLPSRLTRSKDPEPRQRDIVPELSDFFTPTYSEEYCAAVSTKARTPEIADGWNAFRISDQICAWKQKLDDA